MPRAAVMPHAAGAPGHAMPPPPLRHAAHFSPQEQRRRQRMPAPARRLKDIDTRRRRADYCRKSAATRKARCARRHAAVADARCASAAQRSGKAAPTALATMPSAIMLMPARQPPCLRLLSSRHRISDTAIFCLLHCFAKRFSPPLFCSPCFCCRHNLLPPDATFRAECR